MSPPRDADPERRARRVQLAAAGKVARAFFDGYVRFVYRSTSSVPVRGASPELRRHLTRRHALTTPAERATHPRLKRIRLAVAGPPASVLATALVAVGRNRAVRITATLERSRRRWTVVAVGG